MQSHGVSRREWLSSPLKTSIIAAECPGLGRAQSASEASSKIDELVANHILAQQRILEGYGHVSIRDTAPNRYLLSRSLAPAVSRQPTSRNMISTATPLTPEHGNLLWSASFMARSTGRDLT